ncbi:MAG TPA: AI-2E family transporter [Candidatus Paceibacterota bacterium]|nr:AI-2E family transporter [Candidatus Paceibacterota bacterium]
MDKSRPESFPLLVLFLGASILLFFVFAPFFAALSLAVVFAVLLHSPYEDLVRFFGGWKSIPALLTVGVMLVFFIVPLFFLGTQIFQEAQSLYTGMHGNEAQYVRTVQTAIEGPLRQLFPGFVFDLNAYVGNALVFISNNLGSLIYQTLYVLFDTFLMLLALFFFLRDGRSFLASFARMSPFGNSATNDILSKMYETIRSVVRGTLFIAIIRWVCLGVAFTLFGIPNALLWSSIGAIIGAIPGVGTPFALIGAVVYLYLQGNVVSALVLALLGGIIIALVDNFLTSYFFSKGLEISPVFVLFSILGGIVFFGPIGFVLGPLVLSVFLSVIRVYNFEEKKHMESA